MKKQVGLWIRVSTIMQVEAESPEHHKKRGEYYAQSKGWEIKEIYNMEGISGATIFDYPEAKRMFRDIESGHISGLIFSSLSRLARNTKELIEIAELFRNANADLISLAELIDTTTPAGRHFFRSHASSVEWEREVTSERVKASVPIRAKLNKSLGGSAPFGYKWEKNQLILDEKEAPIRKLMFDLFIEHRRRRTVANLLNAKGYRTRKGAKFSDTTVTRLLTNPIAKGQRLANYTQSLGKNKKWVQKPKDQWIFTKVPAIVSEEIWDKANKIIDEQLKRNKRLGKKTVYLFSGYVFCHCGQKMHVPTNTKKHTCKKCRNRISIGDLEEIFKSELKTFILSDEKIQENIDQSERSIDDRKKMLDQLSKELVSLKNKLNNCLDLYHEGQIEKKNFKSHYQPLADRAEQIENEIPEIQATIDYIGFHKQNKDKVINDSLVLYGMWDDLKQDEKRDIIESITNKIVVGMKEIKINLIKLAPFILIPSALLMSPNLSESISPELTAIEQHNGDDVLPICD